MVRRLVAWTAGATLAAAAIDPFNFALRATGVARLMRANPTLFDPEAAAASVEASVEELAWLLAEQGTMTNVHAATGHREPERGPSGRRWR